jgi:hypothetical protein
MIIALTDSPRNPSERSFRTSEQGAVIREAILAVPDHRPGTHRDHGRSPRDRSQLEVANGAVCDERHDAVDDDGVLGVTPDADKLARHNWEDGARWRH